MPESDLAQYKRYVTKRLNQIVPILQEYAIGDFSRTIEVLAVEDEFTELLVGLNFMMDDIRDLVRTETEKSMELTARMEEMIGAIQRVARGDYSVQIETSERNDIIDSHAIGLNMMIDDIRSSFEEVREAQDATLNIMGDLEMREKELSALNRKLQEEINVRKRAQELLATSQERLTGFMEAATDCFMLFDSELNFLEANKTALKYFGRDRDEVVGKNILDVVPHLKENGRRDRYLDVVRTGKPFFSDDSITHPRFGRIHLSLKAFKVGDGLGIIVTDITERKMAEEKLRKSEEKYKTLVESANDFIFLIDKSDRVLSLNKAAARLFGRTPDMVVGKSIFDLFPEEIATGYSEDLQKVFETGETRLSETKMSVGAKEFWISTSLNPVSDHEGRITAVLGVTRDITERKNMEDKLQKTLEELQAKNRELDDFVHMTSHDLKAPLVTIQGFADLLMRKYGSEMNEGARHYVDTIISGAKELNLLVTDLLALSRAGRGKLRLTRVDLAEAFQSILQSLQAMSDDKQAVISVPDDLPVVNYDVTHLKEVFTNLIANALKYSKPDESPRIEVNWRENETENVFWVKDNGLGIEKKYWDKIFLPFERIAQDRKGTGIGLSIVKKIIERHEGRIWIDSMLGVGSTFYFTIPKEVGP